MAARHFGQRGGAVFDADGAGVRLSGGVATGGATQLAIGALTGDGGRMAGAGTDARVIGVGEPFKTQARRLEQKAFNQAGCLST